MVNRHGENNNRKWDYKVVLVWSPNDFPKAKNPLNCRSSNKNQQKFVRWWWCVCTIASDVWIFKLFVRVFYFLLMRTAAERFHGLRKQSIRWKCSQIVFMNRATIIRLQRCSRKWSCFTDQWTEILCWSCSGFNWYSFNCIPTVNLLKRLSYNYNKNWIPGYMLEEFAFLVTNKSINFFAVFFLTAQEQI